MTSLEAIKQFGKYDFERLVLDYEVEELLKLETIKDPELIAFSKLLVDLIKKKKICFMDKEHPSIMEADGIVGYEGKILIFCER